ncbi:MAG: TatD family hydrolase [Clostridia bacterium]|nr:TatD family hydrolase [Clostridia bacterium]
MFDTHAHLDDIKFDDDRESVIDAFVRSGGTYLINASSDIPSSYKSLALADKYGFIYAAAGVHPHETEKMTDGSLDEIARLWQHEKCVAIGEIGLDFYYDFSDRDTQRKWFYNQLELAKQLDAPVIIHDRDAHAECLEAVKKTGVRGVFHCYSGSWETAEELLKIGFYLSFTGAVTFKNARKTVEVAAKAPIDRIMIETDSPYLSPEPLRGTRNNPSNVIWVARKIAEIRGVSVDFIIEQTEKNGKRLFGIGD